jgi:lysozyme
MTLVGIDVSHWQGTVDFAAVKRAGYSFVILKASDGVLSDPTFAGNRARAHVAGLTVGAYHFAEAGDPNAEADNFCRIVGSLAVGELAVLDWETKTANPPLWCKTWLDRVASKLGVRPLIYMNQNTLAGFNWAPVVAGNYGLWLAKYDNSQSQPAGGAWPVVAMKQFTSGGTVPGVSGQCDVDVFYGDAATLAKYGKQPAPVPPPPAPKPPTPTPVPTPEPPTPPSIDVLQEIAAMDPATYAKLVDDIATAAAHKVWTSYFTATSGPSKGQQVLEGEAIKALYQAIVKTA